MIKNLLIALFGVATISVSAQTTPCNTTVYPNGYATFYNLLENGSSNTVKCSFDAVNDVKGTQYGALHTTMLNETPAKYCGMCVEMTGSAGTSILQIVDECPTCTHSTEDIDLSPQAFAAVVGDQSIGIENVSWIEVPCPWTSNVEVIVEGSNYSWAKVIIAKHVNRIAKVEIGSGGTFYEMTRDVSNGWVKSGFGGAWNNFIMEVRITDIYGEEITVPGVDLEINPTYSTVVGPSNFSACSITAAEELNPMDYVVAYPNPATSQITFEGLKDVNRMDIINVNGQIVGTQTIGSNETVSVDLTNLPAGIYVARMTGSVNSGTVTFIKK